MQEASPCYRLLRMYDGNVFAAILAKARECKACTEIGKNLKPLIPHSKWSSLHNCIELNNEIQMVFGGPIINEKGIEKELSTGIDCYSKYPTKRIVNNASSPNVIKFRITYIFNQRLLEKLD